MKTTGKQIWAILIVVGMIMFSGCCGLFGGGGGNPTTTLTGGDGSEVTTTKAGGSQVTTTKPSGGGGGISLDNLLNLGKPTGYTIAYDVTAGGQKMTMTQYYSGQMFRLDTIINVGGNSIEARAYKNADGSFSCTKINDNWMCNGNSEETPTGDTGQTVDVDDLTSKLKSETNVPTYEGTRIIAGATAQCFKADIAGAAATRYCVNSNYAIPLLVESANLAEGQDGYYKMIATSLTVGAPPESTFTLPAKPTDLTDACAVCSMLPADSQAACLANC